MRWVCVGLWLCAVAATPWRPIFSGLACLTTLLIIYERFRPDEGFGTDQVIEHRRLIEVLNRLRFRVGLEQVIPAEVLAGLEESAAQWEQIEAMLATRAWVSQGNLRIRVQNSADHFMMRIVEATLVGHRPFEIDAASERLSRLLGALEAVDRSTFLYPRTTELPPEIPLLPNVALAYLEEALEPA